MNFYNYFYCSMYSLKQMLTSNTILSHINCSHYSPYFLFSTLRMKLILHTFLTKVHYIRTGIKSYILHFFVTVPTFQKCCSTFYRPDVIFLGYRKLSIAENNLISVWEQFFLKLFPVANIHLKLFLL